MRKNATAKSSERAALITTESSDRVVGPRRRTASSHHIFENSDGMVECDLAQLRHPRTNSGTEFESLSIHLTLHERNSFEGLLRLCNSRPLSSPRQPQQPLRSPPSSSATHRQPHQLQPPRRHQHQHQLQSRSLSQSQPSQSRLRRQHLLQRQLLLQRQRQRQPQLQSRSQSQRPSRSQPSQSPTKNAQQT